MAMVKGSDAPPMGAQLQVSNKEIGLGGVNTLLFAS
jgi:hypothetical protein